MATIDRFMEKSQVEGIERYFADEKQGKPIKRFMEKSQVEGIESYAHYACNEVTTNGFMEKSQVEGIERAKAANIPSTLSVDSWRNPK